MKDFNKKVSCIGEVFGNQSIVMFICMYMCKHMTNSVLRIFYLIVEADCLTLTWLSKLICDAVVLNHLI